MNRKEVLTRIVEVGIMPAVRAGAKDLALFAAETLHDAGIPVVEITQTVPNAVDVIAQLSKTVSRLYCRSGNGIGYGDGPAVPGRRRRVHHQPRARP